MRRYLIALLAVLLLATAASGQDVAVAKKKSGGGAATDSCTGGLVFSWHAENADVTLGGVAGGVNNGCSVGDTTGTIASGATLTTASYQDGATSASFPTAGDYYSFTVSSDDIANDAAGTITLYLKLNAATTSCGIWRLRFDANNQVRTMTSGGAADELTYYYIGNSVSRSYTTTGSNLSTDGSTWHQVTFKWSQAGVSEAGSTRYMAIRVDSGSWEYYGTQPTALTSTPTTLVFGDYNGTTGCALQLDNIKVYDSWLAP